VALVLSFAALGLLWHHPRLRSMSAGLRVGSSVEGAVRFLVGVFRAVVLVVFLVVLAAGLVGADDAVSNASPVSVYVIFWVGVPVASVLLGPVWRAVSPWEALGRLVSGSSGREAPGWLTSGWAALVPVSIFHWLELAYHDGASPRVIGWFGLAYTVGLMLMSRRWGWEEVRRAEGFGVLFDALASLSPVRWDGSGRLYVRPPFVGVAETAPSSSLLAVLLAALGGTAFDAGCAGWHCL